MHQSAVFSHLSVHFTFRGYHNHIHHVLAERSPAQGLLLDEQQQLCRCHATHVLSCQVPLGAWLPSWAECHALARRSSCTTAGFLGFNAERDCHHEPKFHPGTVAGPAFTLFSALLATGFLLARTPDCTLIWPALATESGLLPLPA